MTDEVTVDGPPGDPLIGHWWAFERDRLGFLSDCSRRYGETSRFRVVSPTFLINNPDDIRHVLVTNEQNYRKSWRITDRAGRRIFARGLLTKRGAGHLQLRRMVQPAFHRHAVLVFVEAIREHVEAMLASWTADSIVDLTAELDRFAEGTLTQTLVGRLDERTRHALSRTNRARRRFIDHAFGITFPFPQLLPSKQNVQYQIADYRQRRLVRGLVHRAKRGEIDPESMLAQMAAMQSADGRGLSESELFEEVWELLTAGYEATREALTWSAYLLAKHPECAARLRDEVRRVVGDRAVRPDDVPALAYAEMFFSESLRLFPPTWMFVRVAVSADVLPSGVHVTTGSKIFLCQYTAHRNETFFPDPDRFDPDRFDPEVRQKRPRFSYFPFGGGTRVCIAEPLARLEGVILLASMAARFDLELCPGPAIEPVGAITLRPNHPVRVVARPAPR